jgi:hypothetical protein
MFAREEILLQRLPIEWFHLYMRVTGDGKSGHGVAKGQVYVKRNKVCRCKLLEGSRSGTRSLFLQILYLLKRLDLFSPALY